MPEEFSRTTARKRIPVASSYVDIPVITKISFIDPYNRHQETEFTIDNSSQSSREVHVDTVRQSADGMLIGGSQLFVERVDRFKISDAYDRHQETEIEFDNVTGGDSLPPHFSTHLQTHVVRYKNPDDSATWIESELIDEFVVVDPYDRHQETHYVLDNPQTDDEAQANPNDPEISDTGNGIDSPWRTDPFQNIINMAGGGPIGVYAIPTLSGNITLPFGSDPPIMVCSPVADPPPAAPPGSLISYWYQADAAVSFVWSNANAPDFSDYQLPSLPAGWSRSWAAWEQPPFTQGPAAFTVTGGPIDYSWEIKAATKTGDVFCASGANWGRNPPEGAFAFHQSIANSTLMTGSWSKPATIGYKGATYYLHANGLYYPSPE